MVPYIIEDVPMKHHDAEVQSLNECFGISLGHFVFLQQVVVFMVTLVSAYNKACQIYFPHLIHEREQGEKRVLK